MKWLILILLLTGCATARPWTTEEKVMLGMSCLAVGMDMYTTMNCVNGGDCETNPVMGNNPSDMEVVTVMITTQLLTVVLAHYWDDFRMWVLGIKTGINVGFAFHNIRTD